MRGEEGSEVGALEERRDQCVRGSGLAMFTEVLEDERVRIGQRYTKSVSLPMCLHQRPSWVPGDKG